MYELCRCIIEYINSINELPALFIDTDWCAFERYKGIL